MKKIILSLLVLLLLTGCISVKKSSIDEILSASLHSKRELYNRYNKGYKYYKPNYLSVKKLNEFNDLIKSKKYDYYLYVDLVSYYNKTNTTYKAKENIYYSKLINNNDKLGVVNIECDNFDCLVDMKYNYGSFQAKCSEVDIKEVISDGIIILSSLKYNDDVVKNILTDNILTSKEEIINLFPHDKEKDESLDVIEDIYNDEDEEIDPDLIN